jgi:hypothetical protein
MGMPPIHFALTRVVTLHGDDGAESQLSQFYKTFRKRMQYVQKYSANTKKTSGCRYFSHSSFLSPSNRSKRRERREGEGEERKNEKEMEKREGGREGGEGEKEKKRKKEREERVRERFFSKTSISLSTLMKINRKETLFCLLEHTPF